MNLLAELRRRFAEPLAGLAGDAAGAAELAAMVMPIGDPKFGDYQFNGAMPLAKKLGKPPREIAAALVEKLDVADLCEPPTIAGPGFINLKLRDDALAAQLAAAVGDAERLGVPTVATPRTYVLDYSSPNVAKPMHVGHIRTTVIGDVLYKVLKFLGHRTISDNHIGDWGTQFGMIIYGWKQFGDEAAFARAPVAELSRLYKWVNQLIEYHGYVEDMPNIASDFAKARDALEELEKLPPSQDAKENKKRTQQTLELRRRFQEASEEFEEARASVSAIRDDPEKRMLADLHPSIFAAVLAETAALHAGDATNRALWERFLPPCLEDIEAIYRRLHVRFDHALGESFYEDKLAGVVESLTACGLAKKSEGALCVFLDGYEAPFIVQKKDGAFLYATTDLATIQYRMETWKPDAILYVVDHRQSLHFEQLFATAKLWGYSNVELAHISFGTVLGDDGKPFKTRSGASVGLMGLLDEAVKRAGAIAAQSDVLTTDEQRQTVAERVGIGAIKYADLAHNRTSDYKFSYDKMLAMNGNTAAYMQFGYARVSSIFGKGNVDVARLRLDAAPITLAEPAERALGLAILQFAEALDRVAADYRPNYLTDYLFDLAGKYASFFENCPVLKAPSDELRTSRLLLCDLTARTLAKGLGLLGIQTVERM